MADGTPKPLLDGWGFRACNLIAISRRSEIRGHRQLPDRRSGSLKTLLMKEGVEMEISGYFFFTGQVTLAERPR